MQPRRGDVAAVSGLCDDLPALDGVALLDLQFAVVGIARE
jgi:hypothetical protein